MGVADEGFAVLTNLGEKMSDEEVDELLKAVDTSSGEINYTGIFHLPILLKCTHIVDQLFARPRPDHPRQLRRLSLSLSQNHSLTFSLPPTIHILQALSVCLVAGFGRWLSRE